MTTKNEQLYKEAMEAITELFSDTSVDAQTSSDNLRTLQGEIEDLISVLQADIYRAELEAEEDEDEEE